MSPGTSSEDGIERGTPPRIASALGTLRLLSAFNALSALNSCMNPMTTFTATARAMTKALR